MCIATVAALVPTISMTKARVVIGGRGSSITYNPYTMDLRDTARSACTTKSMDNLPKKPIFLLTLLQKEACQGSSLEQL